MKSPLLFSPVFTSSHSRLSIKSTSLFLQSSRTLRPIVLYSSLPRCSFKDSKVRIATPYLPKSSFFREISTTQNLQQRKAWRNYHVDEKGSADWGTLVVYGLLAINGIVFALWQVPDRKMELFLMKNFTVSLRNLQEGRIWTLITPSFSQESIIHFFANAFGLYSFGPVVCQMIGARRFLILYVMGGITSALTHIGAFYYRYRDRRREATALGASGSLMAVMAVFTCLAPRARIIALFIPMEARYAFGAFMVFSIYGAIFEPGSYVGHAAHLGGAGYGLGYYLLALRR